MKMAEVQAGLGFGMKKFRLVWVFEKKHSSIFRQLRMGTRHAEHGFSQSERQGALREHCRSHRASGSTSSPTTASRSS